MEMEQVQEVDMFPHLQTGCSVIPRPFVIMKPTKKPAPEPTPSLSDILTSCGIEYDLVESDAASSVASPSSLHSDLEKTQELIDELEDFFMKTEGAPTVVDDQEMKMVIPEPILESNNNNNLTMGDLEQAVLQVRPSQGRSTPDPSLSRHLLDRIQQTRRKGRRLRTEPQPSGTERR